jgi:hypothetical protein
MIQDVIGRFDEQLPRESLLQMGNAPGAQTITVDLEESRLCFHAELARPPDYLRTLEPSAASYAVTFSQRCTEISTQFGLIWSARYLGPGRCLEIWNITCRCHGNMDDDNRTHHIAVVHRVPAQDQVDGNPAQRLARAVVRLEAIDLMRDFFEDSAFGKLAEEAIIQRELVELELQYVDDEVHRISATAVGPWIESL